MVMKKVLLLLLTGLVSIGCFAQVKFSCIVKDEGTGEPLPNVSILTSGGEPNTVTDNIGIARLLVKSGKYFFNFSSSGYKPQAVLIDVQLKTQDSIFTILLKKSGEVIIYSTRTDSRIENSPIKVEVLGKENLEKESGVKPSHIARLLGDVTGIQSQQTSAVSGNTELRIQGLPGNYTQILRDGMPLFGGYAGSFSILQMPPLDLKQIEIIKGPVSTLYGGGAIAGTINFISKKPKLGENERTLLLNQSSLQETNLNLYLSERSGKMGFTFFGGANYQKQKDINNDGFSDAGRLEGIFLHTTVFYFPNEKNTISLGVNSNYEDRKGGDMELLAGYYSNFHQFFIQNQTYRNTLDLAWENTISRTEKFMLKASTSNFNRNISTSVSGFKAKQLTYYTEASYVKKMIHHDLVVGMNLAGENLTNRLPDSSLLDNYKFHTVGLFIQDDWRLHRKLTIQSGLRTDFHTIYKAFILPRISILYKFNQVFTMRMSGGLGYKIPTVFDSEVDERYYPKLLPLQNMKAERSTGFNWDLNFKKEFGKVELSINQSFFLTQINNPVLIQKFPTAISYINTSEPLSSKGIETWLQFRFAGLATYLSYTLTDSRKKYDPLQPYLELNPRNKFASVVSYEISKHFRVLLETVITGRQYLENDNQTPSFPIVAGMMRYDVGHFSFVLNCENIFDYRQTKKEAIVIPPYINPSFKQLWAPIDGRVANLSIQIKL
jgi:outer membrane receptor for ferrienterochelin and colicin